jgi:hypothetical protein
VAVSTRTGFAGLFVHYAAEVQRLAGLSRDGRGSAEHFRSRSKMFDMPPPVRWDDADPARVVLKGHRAIRKAAPRFGTGGGNVTPLR